MNEMQHLDWSFVRSGLGSDESSVEVRTIDHLTQQYGKPDLLKIDIERAEVLALEGAGATLSNRTRRFA